MFYLRMNSSSKFVGVKGDPSTWGSKGSNISSMNKDVEVAPDSKKEEIPKKKGLFDNLDFSKPPPGLLPEQPLKVSSSTGSPMESSDEPVGESGAKATSMLAFQRELAPATSSNEEEKDVAERPPLDLFKEIFADSSDSENEDAQEALLRSSQMSPEKAHKSHHFISQHMLPEAAAARDDKPLDKIVSSNDDKNSLPPENESVNQQKESRRRGVFDRIDLDRLQDNAHRFLLGTGNNKSSRSPTNNSDEDMDETYGPAPPKDVPSATTSRQQHQSRSSLSMKYVSSAIPAASSSSIHARYKSVLDDSKREVSTEEVIWVEKSALSDGSSGSKSHAKSKKHSAKKSRRKSNKKEKRKSHKSSKQRHKQKKKGRKHKSKSKHHSSSDESGSSTNEDGGSDASSDSSVTINDSLDNRALLAKLKQITRSN